MYYWSFGGCVYASVMVTTLPDGGRWLTEEEYNEELARIAAAAEERTD